LKIANTTTAFNILHIHVCSKLVSEPTQNLFVSYLFDGQHY